MVVDYPSRLIILQTRDRGTSMRR